MGKVLFMDLLSAAYHLQREYVLEKHLVNSIKICVDVDRYFSIDVQLTRFGSSLRHYIFEGDNKAENMRKWQEVMDYIATATEPVETIQERIEKLKNKK
jgi:hypothetical protein